MNRRSTFVSLASAVVAVLACAACNGSLDSHSREAEVTPPSQVVDFNLLYSQNCAGCHGVNGKGGAAFALANPVFLAIADDTVIRRTAVNGVAGTPMPAFAQSAGGMLTDKQIDVLIQGIRSWANPGALGNQTAPPYLAKAPGDPQRGAEVYRTYCSSCHGAEGRGGSKASSIVDGSFLALISDQHLRTLVIAGRPEIDAPDWRGDVAGQPIPEQGISDVVAWLSAQRPKFSGRPAQLAVGNSNDGGSR